MNIAAIIVGIDGWEKYTLPLIQTLRGNEPECNVIVVDNHSEKPYPVRHEAATILRTPEMRCYSRAINIGKKYSPDVDWYIVLSNDVLCIGPFAHILAEYDASAKAIGGADLVGPLLKEVHGFPYLEGWTVCVPAQAWQPWDERFLGSDWEDVAYSTHARQRGHGLIEDRRLPFIHLDQKQRYHIVDDFWAKDAHNRDLFMREYAAVTA